MTLYVVQPEDVVNWVTVTSIDDQKAEGTMTLVTESMARPEVGWQCSTKPGFTRKR